MNLPKIYEPHQYEADIYALWEKSQAFTPVSDASAKPFSIVMPPPNANANMHIGYELTAALEDIATRYHRMKGEPTLLLPGADHAGFETQSVYEKHLAKAGKSRFDFDRESLYQQIWDFVALNRGNFEKQLRAMGVSCDWARFTFTLDDKIIKQAYSTFKKMWQEGLIYRGERLVNYCTFHGTGFADIEVAYEDSRTPLYYIKYGPFELATTRPETKFGDTAVAVHPDDARYQQWIGKVITVEGVNGPFDVQVIADTMVDQQFGTGVVKITPAHSFDDWEVAQRHQLPVVRVINHDGTMNERAGKYRGMTVLEARQAVAVALAEKGLLIKVDQDYQNRVGKCYKCGTVIEPMLLEQWLIDMKPLTEPAIAALKANKITFYPSAKKDQLISYLEGLRDWNISRQIAWGIPIPAFQNIHDRDDWIYDERVDQEIIQVGNKTYHRDPDVFDTWFSSSSWPYATLDYPDGDAFKQFYPLSMMETGGEILYPWVSRMIMLSLYVTGEIPFKEVYIHGYVMAEDGSKMSKSIGNVIDPFPVIEKYGSDALRMGIIAGRSPAVNRGYDSRKVEEARNFCNKLWNVARYVESQVGDSFEVKANPEIISPADAWIMHKLQEAIGQTSELLMAYRFSEASELVYHLLWDDFADWYIEASKSALNKGVLGYGLETILKLAHPFAPFVTETIWQTLKWETDSLLMCSAWPVSRESSPELVSTFTAIMTIVTEIRYTKASMGVGPGLSLVHDNEKIIHDNAEMIQRLARLDEVSEGEESVGIRLTTTTLKCWLNIDAPTAEKFAAELVAKQKTLENDVAQLQQRLANTSYTEKAPTELVEQTRQQLSDTVAALTKIKLELSRLAK
ncbi:MAG: valine--tRNA ligase [Candidatus Saccharimonadales bacterium]